ncbi:hypothetical protein ACSYT7_22280, partial [Escherichia coli]
FLVILFTSFSGSLVSRIPGAVHTCCDKPYIDDNHYHFRGSFPAIRPVTGRRPRGFSLFMKIFREKSDPFFFFLTD